MRTSNILLGLSLVLLYGCQPETPAQQATAPVVNEPAQVASVQQTESTPVEEAAQLAATETSVQQAATPVASEPEKVAPAQQARSAPVEKAAQPAVAKTPALSAPVQVIDAPATETNPAPVAETPPEPVVSEADAMQLAKKNNCFACHAVGKKVVGPSFKDIAAKYRNDPGAEAMLMGKIAKGGSGVWGVMVMPPSPKISETDRRILAKLVLSSK
ncbi:MAG TPA: c-type cytochrome [Gallionella sp.]|nr:c-type cytochrome [Gallionella sp.]